MVVQHEPWLFDRSRYTTGLGHCNMERYLRYHRENPGVLAATGLQRSGLYVPLATGQHCHSGLASVLEAVMARPSFDFNPDIPPDAYAAELRDIFRPGIEAAVAAYAAEYEKAGFVDVQEGEEAAYLLAEQSALVRGMSWGFVRSQLPGLIAEFEVVEVEREGLMQVGEYRIQGGCEEHPGAEACVIPIVYMLRPDAVLRRRRDRKLFTLDFKTAYSLEDSWQRQWENNLQMATQGLEVEIRLGEKVEGYYMLGLLKGSRRSVMIDDGDGGKVKGPRRQSSVWCYGYLNPGNPPIQEPAWEHEYTRKKGYSRAAIWQDYEGGPEALAFAMPERLLHEQFLLLGPFERNETTIQRWLQEAPHEEARWIERLRAIKRGEPVEQHVTSSWECWQYEGPCSFVPACYGFPSWEGLYKPREPHHEEEKRRFLEVVA